MEKSKDTYSSKIRNLLTPVANITTIIEMYKSGDINKDTFLDYIVSENLKYSLDKLIELTEKSLLKNTVYDE